MVKIYSTGTDVSWKWGQGHARGKILKSSVKRMQKTIKGSKTVRNGREENPAYLIEQKDGSQVLKLHSELTLLKDA